jgi:hypothetical protein
MATATHQGGSPRAFEPLRSSPLIGSQRPRLENLAAWQRSVHDPMPSSQRPILLIDVDGVISLFGGMPHFLSRRAAVQLVALAAAFECVWCTGWEERAEEHLPRLLGLPRGWPHLTFDSTPVPDTHWKIAAIDALAGPQRPLAWVDDAHDARCVEWASARPGPTLLVSTDPAVGLTDSHAERLLEWAASLTP